MNLGRTLISALIGAAIGLGLHLALGAVTKSEMTWFAIIAGALTGLTVRQASKSSARQVSYVRGAVTAIIALAAIFASQYLVQVVIARASMPLDVTEQPRIEETVEPSTETSADATEGEPTAVATEDQEPVDEEAAGKVVARPSARQWNNVIPNEGIELPTLNPWDFFFVAVGVFLAYKFARGTAVPPPAMPAPETSLSET